MKKIINIMLCLILVISTSGMVFANESEDANIASTDHTVILNDSGLYNTILAIEDAEKRGKLLDYFYTPAYYTSSSANSGFDIEKEFEAEAEQCLAIVENLMALSDEDFDANFETMVKDTVNEIIKMEDVVIIEDFVGFVAKTIPESAVELRAKDCVLSEKNLEIEIGTGSLGIAPRANLNFSYTAVGSIKSGSLTIASLRTVIKWKFDSAFNEAYDVTKTSTTYIDPGAGAASYFIPVGNIYDKTKISWSGNMSYVHVHIAKEVTNPMNSGVISGYLTTNVKIKGDNTSVTDNSAYLSPVAYKTINWL